MSFVDIPTATAASETTYETQASENTDNPNKWSKNGFGVPVQYQTGQFTKEESELVKSSIAEYCVQKDIPVSRLCAECEHKAELKGAWMEIAKKLPHRSVQSVYRHGIRQCHPFKRGTWTEQECNELQELVSSLGKKWSTIQAKMNRSADSCRDKYREMSEEYVRGRWNDEETFLFQKYIQEYLTSPAVKNLVVKENAMKLRKVNVHNDDDDHHQNGDDEGGVLDMIELGKVVTEAIPPIHIPWHTISKKMSNRSRLSCFKKWQKLTGMGSSSSSSSDNNNADDDDNNNEKRKRKRKDGTTTKTTKMTKSSKQQKSMQTQHEQLHLAAEPTRKLKRLRLTTIEEEQKTTEQVVDDALAAASVTVVTRNRTTNNGDDSAVCYDTTDIINHNQEEDPEDIVSYDDAAEMAAVTVEAVDLPNIGTTPLLTSI